jgi:LacI family transcriptional regulator
MKDIARDLDVSVVTVSKVLRNHPDVGAETRERVLKRAKELGYRPNLAARALVTGRTFMMGLIVPDLVHPFFAEVAKGIAGHLRSEGYSLVIASSEENPEIEKQEIENLLARRMDAIILASSQWTVESFRRMEEQGTPYVLLDRKFVGLAANFVGVDDEMVGAVATKHLIDRGYKRIGHIRGLETSTSLGRLEGYRRTLARHGSNGHREYIVTGKSADDKAEESGFDAMKELLSREPRPDAVFCYNDPVALGAMRAILDAALRIPEDVGVVGCGNAPFSDLLRIPLTTVDQDIKSIGEHAARLALRLATAKEAVRPQEILIEPKLAERASSAGPEK